MATEALLAATTQTGLHPMVDQAIQEVQELLTQIEADLEATKPQKPVLWQVTDLNMSFASMS